jgi:PEP-CTERM motif-containing protein
MKKLAISLFVVACSTGALADDFRHDVTEDPTVDTTGDGITENIQQHGFSQTIATSVYSCLDVGCAVYDGNITSELENYGFNGSAGGNLSGVPSFIDPEALFSYRNIDTLNPLNPGYPDNDDTAGFPSDWGISFNYELFGTVIDLPGGLKAADYTSGYFDLFYSSAAVAPVQVARLNVTGSFITAADFLITGEIVYDWDGVPGDDAGALAKEFFVDAASGETFYEKWLAGSPVSFRLDSNVDSSIAPDEQFVAGIPKAGFEDSCKVPTGGDGPNVCLIRQTELDGSIAYAVPAPGVLALMGIGLFGLGMSRRKARA